MMGVVGSATYGWGWDGAIDGLFGVSALWDGSAPFAGFVAAVAVVAAGTTLCVDNIHIRYDQILTNEKIILKQSRKYSIEGM